MIGARRLVVIVLAFSAAALVPAGLLAFPDDDADDAASAKPAAAPTWLREGFETPQPTWEREYTDTTVNLIAQERSQRAAHGGKQSERFLFEAGTGGKFFVSYAAPKVAVTDELSVGLWVRSNRGGVQIFGRVVLPADIDPETKAASFLLIPGTIFTRVDRWEKLELLAMMPAIEQQARVLRSSTRRPVQLKGAYLERVVVNLMGGQGETEVFLDDLEIGPIKTGATKPEVAAGTTNSPARANPKVDATDELPAVRLVGNVLQRRGRENRYYSWLPTAITAPGADIVKLREHGFDILMTKGKPDQKQIDSAVSRGFMLLPELIGAGDDDGPRRLIEQMAAYPRHDAVAAWTIGDHLGKNRDLKARKAELDSYRAVLSAMHDADDGQEHLTTATVDGELRLFARAPANLDIIGIRAPVWASSQSLLENLSFLSQRHALTVRSNPGGQFWAHIPAATPPDLVRNIWGYDSVPTWGTPTVQPEQLRLMTYSALIAGCRGLVFHGDAALTSPSPAERSMLIELGFLNEEIDLCEGILADNVDAIQMYNVYDPDPSMLPTTANASQKKIPTVAEYAPKPGLKAAAIPVPDRGVLLMVADFADNAQFQPPQMAYHNITITANLPSGSQAMEISPGEVRFLEKPERVPGGTKLTLPDFGTSTLILCTTNMELCERIRVAVERNRHIAVGLAIEQAELQLQMTKEIHARLAADGHELRAEKDVKARLKAGIVGRPPDAKDLLAKSEEFLKDAREAQERQQYDWAWSQARRSVRPLRILMNGYWNEGIAALTKAAKSIDPKRPDPPEDPKVAERTPRLRELPPLLVKPISCPPAISFATLPEMYIWADWIKGRKGYRFGENRVPSGDFSDPDAIVSAGWKNVAYEYEGITTSIKNVLKYETPRTKHKLEIDDPDIEPDETNRAVKLTVKPERTEDFDTMGQVFLDFPAAAIMSPPIRVEANNLIRISVLLKRPYQSPPGMGGIIVRDSIGGEQLQFRTSDSINDYYRLVLFRKAPADGTFNVTLGLAGYGDAYFDDFRVEVIEEAPRYTNPNLARGRGRPPATAARSPDLPAATLPTSATLPTDTRRQQR